MEWLFDEPSVVLIGVTLAAVLVVVELALPTVGIAGLLAFFTGAVAVGGLVNQDLTWWPLLGTAGATVLWAVLILRRQRSPVVEAVAAVVLLGAGLAFGFANDDVASIVVAVVSAAALAWSFPYLHTATTRLASQPVQSGMEALIGQAAVVDAWTGERGVVLLEGSRWNAVVTDDYPVAAGDVVHVVAFRGSTVLVAPAGRWTAGRAGPPTMPPAPPQTPPSSPPA